MAMLTRIAITAITTKSSTRVKPLLIIISLKKPPKRGLEGLGYCGSIVHLMELWSA